MKLSVVGAGIGGLTLALCAHSRGLDVQLFEAAPEMLPPEDRERLRQAIAKRLWTDHEDKELWRSLPAARLEIDEIRKDDSGEALAGEFEAWFAAFEARFPAIDIGNALPGDAE